MFLFNVLWYTSGAVRALTIEDAIVAMRYQVITGTSYYTTLR